MSEQQEAGARPAPAGVHANDQQILQFMTTEYAALQSARSTTTFEANGVIGALIMALLGSRFLGTATALTIGVGIVTFIILVTLHMWAQSRCFETAYNHYDSLFPSAVSPTTGEHIEA